MTEYNTYGRGGRLLAMVAGMASAMVRFGRAAGNAAITLDGFNNQHTPRPERKEFTIAHISPADIRRRRSKGRQHKTNRLHLSKKAKLKRRRAA